MSNTPLASDLFPIGNNDAFMFAATAESAASQVCFGEPMPFAHPFRTTKTIDGITYLVTIHHLSESLTKIPPENLAALSYIQFAITTLNARKPNAASVTSLQKSCIAQLQTLLNDPTIPRWNGTTCGTFHEANQPYLH